MTKRKRAAVLVVVSCLTAIGALVWVCVLKPKREKFYTGSCANHFIQLRLTLYVMALEHPDLILPATNDTRSALAAIFAAGGRADFGLGALRGYGSACPESFKRDRSIGYVYVGDGLRLGDVNEKGILILFCPGENHRGSSEHCHAWSLSEGRFCVLSNAKMIAELERAIGRGESGAVPYSERAMAVLREELAKRKAPK